MNSIARRLVLAVAAIAVPAIAFAQAAHVTGTLTYRERIALSPEAVVEVRIDDVTRVGAAPLVVAKTRVSPSGQLPIRFEITYDPRTINPQARYAVRATIADRGVELFASLDTALVLTQGHGTHVDLMLTRIGTPKPAPPVVPPPPPAPPLPPPPFASLPVTFVGTLPCADCDGIRYQLNLFGDDSFFLQMAKMGKPDVTSDLGSWALSSDRRMLVLRGSRDEMHWFQVVSPSVLRKVDAEGQPPAGRPQELGRSTFKSFDVRRSFRGSYSDVGNAATFVECSTGQRWDLAASAAAAELRKAYVAGRYGPGAGVLVELEGHVTEGTQAEGSRTGRVLVVDKAGRVLPKETCAARFTSAALVDTHWRLTHLGTRTMPAATDPRREPSITFQAGAVPNAGGFAGSTGCNRLNGQYEIANATVKFTAGGTLVACKDQAANEAAFLAALKAARTWRITGRVFELMDEKGARLARFEARMPTGITVR